MISAEYRTVDKRKIAINDNELSARLGRVCSHTDPELFRVYEALLREAEPKYAFRRVKLAYPTENSVDLGFSVSESAALIKNLCGCKEAFVVACTLGIEVDRLIARLSKTSRAEAFIFDGMASALTEAVTDVMESEITEGLATAPRFSPGYADFSIECQPSLLDFLGAPVYLGITVGESCLMTPMKTVTAIIGIKE